MIVLYKYYSIIHMKDTIKKIIASILSLGGLAVLGFYVYQWMPVVKDYMAQYTWYVLGAFAVLFLAFFLQFGIVVLPAKWLKVRAVVLGLVIAMGWYYFIANDAAINLFAGDVIWLIWVLMIYLTLAWWIVTKSAQKKVEQWKQIVIEV